jgi:hypothetical protein
MDEDEGTARAFGTAPDPVPVDQDDMLTIVTASLQLLGYSLHS